MGYLYYDTDQLLKGKVDYEMNQTMTVVNATTYKDGAILVRDTTSGKLIPYVKATHGSSNFAKYVLPYEVVATATGDIIVSVIKRTIDKGLDKDLLVIQADGDASNVDAAVIDQLRDYNIQVETFTQNSVAGRGL